MRTIEYGRPTDKAAIGVQMGIDRGFFRDEGIDLRIRTVYGGPELAATYDSGELLFGQIGSPPGVTAIAHGARFRIVGGGMRRAAHMYLGVRSDIGSYEELKGRRIGILSRGSCAEWFLRNILLNQGLDPDRDIEIVPLAGVYPRLLDEIRDGRIDGALTIEPNLALGETLGILKVWRAVYDEPNLPRVQWAIRVANTGFIEKEPELLRALLRACRRSTQYALAHPAEWQAFIVERYGIDPDSAAVAAGRELPQMHGDGEIDLDGLQTIVDLQRRLGAIEGPLNAADLVDLRFLPEAAV